MVVERDWEQQEFLIGAVLSGDEAMFDAYVVIHIYLWAFKQDQFKNATKDHPKRYKTVCLQLQYGSGTQAIADRLRCTYEKQIFLFQCKRYFLSSGGGQMML